MFGNFPPGNVEEALDALGHQAWQNLGSLKLKNWVRVDYVDCTNKNPSFLHQKETVLGQTRFSGCQHAAPMLLVSHGWELNKHMVMRTSLVVPHGSPAPIHLIKALVMALPLALGRPQVLKNLEFIV